MTAASNTRQSITGAFSELYDVFVDWEGRLGREMPGIVAHLEGNGARRVLDVGCGTGRHVGALLERGFEAHGADASEDMLSQAAGLLGGSDRLHPWRLGDEPPDRLVQDGPFDAVIAMGNLWPLIPHDRDARAAARALCRLVRPGGLVLLGMKAFLVRLETKDPYLPLLRRVHEGRPLWFVRFVDFEVPDGPEDEPWCDLHLSVLAGDAEGEPEPLLHRAHRVRAWSPALLRRWFTEEGFEHVRVSGRLDDPEVAPSGEDVFVDARTPAG